MSALRELVGDRQPRVLLTLGSGLGALADEIADPMSLPFADIGLPTPTVPGHAGRLIAGTLEGVPVLVQQGRIHLYEGAAPSDVTAAVRAAAEAGVETFVATNAAGGVADAMEPGEVMIIGDHLNLTGTSPLIRPGEAPHFLDMSAAYDAGLRGLAAAAAEAEGVRSSEGIYAGLVGPAFETPAEVRMLRTLGADAVGMSTVLEVLQARALGLRVLGLSLITNVHRAGGTPTDHQEVLEAGRLGGPRLAGLLRRVLSTL